MRSLQQLAAVSIVLLQAWNAGAQNTFPATGNVGIGTNCPAALLDVRGSNAVINGVKVGIGNCADTTSTVLGRNAMNFNGSNSYNTAIGGNALLATTGTGNVAVGFKSLMYNSGGSNNTGIGTSALYRLYGNSNNTAIGSSAMSSIQYGSENVALGVNALRGACNNQVNDYNVAIGNYALEVISGGDYNTATGYRALNLNEAGSYNTATGYNALDSTISGMYNTAQGYMVMARNSSGGFNTAGGGYALYNNSTGLYNVAQGYGSLYNNTTGTCNTGVGYYANVTNANLTNATAIGFGCSANASNQVRIGNSTVSSIGGYANWTNVSDGRVKMNIKDNVPGLAFINQLQPVTYNLDLAAAEKLTGTDLSWMRKEPGGLSQQFNKARRQKEQIVYSGFIAQDVEKAAQSMQYDFSGVDAPKSSTDLYGLRYAEFVVPLVKAVQELSKQNEELKKAIEQNNQYRAVKEPAVVYETVTISSASVQQNSPNPFKGTTSISYTLPEGAGDARIVINDKQGITIKTIPVTAARGVLTLNAAALAAGTYQYALLVKGVVVATHQMVLAR